MLNAEKCHFFLTNVTLLGHIISRDGIQPDDEKIVKVKNYPVPTTIRQLRGFLGLASYYRKFIKNFSTIAKPLNQLLEKDVSYLWTNQTQQAFETLKNHLISAPILRYPDFNRPFYLHTDASGTGLGAVLAQRDDDNKEYAVAYASRSLTKPERNYAITEQECLAVVWAVEHFHQYLGTSHFYLVTDHSALKWLKTTELKGRRARWILRLEPYNYTIIHRAGRKHNNADAMSRMYEEVPVQMLDNIDWSNPEDYQIELPEPSPTSPTFEDWFHAGQYCPECKNQTDEHHTHSYCKNCGKLSDRNRYPFLDNCKCKGKQRLHSIPRSATTQSTQIILTEPNPWPLPKTQKPYPKRLYNNLYIPRQSLEEPAPAKLYNNFWWLDPLDDVSDYYRDEFNNYSDHYLCNSVWWMDTNPVTYY